jgi:uncharacterized protein (DUF1778 family)
LAAVSEKARNTRGVFPIRLSAREREQIEGAAKRQQLTIGGFIRQASLAASAIVQGKARVREQAPKTTEPPREPLVVIDTEPAGHYVDGELVKR